MGTAVVESTVEIWCDHENCHHLTMHTIHGDTFNPKPEAQLEAVNAGWEIDGARIYCPNHSTNGVRKSKTAMIGLTKEKRNETE